MDNINLNFLPLTDQNFGVTIYRKKTEKTNEKGETGIRFRLKPDDSYEYESFDISWVPRDGFVEYTCPPKENYNLTKQFLLRCIESKLENGCAVEYYSPSKSFYKEFRFVMSKYKEGQSEIRFQPYFLEAHNEFGFLIQHHFKVNKEQPFNREVQKLSLSLDNRYQQNRSFYGDKYKITMDFVNQVVSSIGVLINGISISTTLADTPTDILATKHYLVGNNQQSNSQYTGIKHNGPYARVSDRVKYLFVFTEPLRSLARDVYSGLDGKLFSGMFSGLDAMFKLPFGKEQVAHFLIREYNNESIQEISDKAIQMQEDGKHRVCVLTFFPLSMNEEKNHEIYSHIKLKAIEGNFYTQVIKQETMGKKEQLKWSIGNIGLQIFSKLGGVPWLMVPSHQNCLIFGIGSSHEKDSDGNIQKYTAYTVCIDTKGDFKRIQPLSSSKNEDEYLSCLKEELVKAISSGENDDVDECVIHIPFKIQRSEIRAIRESVEEIRSNVNFEIKVIKINTKHKYFGFSKHNTKVPYESTMVQLSKTEYLIWTEGLQYGKSTINRRVSEPIHVQFLDSSNGDYDEDKAYLQDVINLTGANWRGFNSKAQPVSIYYSKLIADFMRRFGAYESVGDFSVLSQESFNPWFL